MGLSQWRRQGCVAAGDSYQLQISPSAIVWCIAVRVEMRFEEFRKCSKLTDTDLQKVMDNCDDHTKRTDGSSQNKWMKSHRYARQIG